jgi:hypothetical protein
MLPHRGECANWRPGRERIETESRTEKEREDISKQEGSGDSKGERQDGNSSCTEQKFGEKAGEEGRIEAEKKEKEKKKRKRNKKSKSETLHRDHHHHRHHHAPSSSTHAA